MDITTATITAAAIVGFLSPVIVQVSKRWIAKGWTEIYSVAVSALLAVIAIGATGGFAHATWGAVLLAVIGVAQTIYATVNTAISGKLSSSYDNSHVIDTTAAN
ncbi:hypothetical protein [Bifidobacterium subtile]|jgi:hypothetical protein|uniref:hypothetical protein n=1 Tax=Bifidobacterium subtile TaxID=77635 RepID=UPI002F35EB7B